MIRAVLLDFDGVLTIDRTGSASTVRSLCRYTGIPEETLLPAYRRHLSGLLAGTITHEMMWDELCREAGQDIGYDLLNAAFTETPLDCAMLDLVEDIHGSCRTALVTNNTVERIAAIFDHHGLHERFDAVTVSAEVGSGKESRLIFETTLEALNVAAHECIFIDNTARNLEIPRQMGMATVLFDDVRRDVNALRRLLTNNCR